MASLKGKYRFVNIEHFKLVVCYTVLTSGFVPKTRGQISTGKHGHKSSNLLLLVSCWIRLEFICAQWMTVKVTTTRVAT